MPPDMDMIGEHEIDALELQIGHGHVVYTGGAKGTDELVKQLGKQFGMQVEVLVPPNHPRATFITPSTVEVLMLANPHLHQAVEKLGKRMPQSFLHPAIAATQLSNCQESPYPLCLWHLGTG